MYTEITSRTNEHVKFVAELAKSAALRQEQNLFFAEGAKLCMDLANNFKAQTVFFTEKALEQHPQLATLAAAAFQVQPHVAEKLSLTKTTQGVFAVFEKSEHTLEDIDYTKGAVLCENLQDPGNVGTIVRTAAGLGLGGVILCADCADPYSPKTLRASSGGIGRLPVVVVKDTKTACEQLKAQGVTLYTAAMRTDAKILAEVKKTDKFAIGIGSEGSGASETLLSSSDEIMYLPMQNGVESLNAGVAAAIFMHHMKSFI